MNGKSTPSPDTNADGQTAAQRSVDTRFKARNTAARVTGLRAGSRKELRRRDVRTSRLLGKYLALRADLGRPIGPTVLPLARRYVELEILARDHYAAVTARPFSPGHLQDYLSITRAQSLIAAQLGESLASTARLAVIGSQEPDVLLSLANRRRLNS